MQDLNVSPFPYGVDPFDSTDTPNTCWQCGSDQLQPGGTDGNGQPVTVCARCGERQEEE